MSARVVLAIAVVLAAGSARADEKVAPMTKVESSSSSSGGNSAPSSSWTKETSSNSGSSARSEASFARSRSGSSSSSRSSSAGQRHGTARSRSGSSGGAPPRTAAQARHPRPGTGTGHFDNNHGGYYGGRYPYYGSRYGYGYGYGRYGYGYGYGYPRYGYGYGFGYGYPYYYYSPFYFSGYYGYSPAYYGGGYGHEERDRDEGGSLRIIVEPVKARVYVDGYYAGIVDDFDGVFQRLNVSPGRHEIALRLEGYRTQIFKVNVPGYDTIKIHYEMVRGTGEATSEEFAGPPDAEYARARDMSDEDRRRAEEDRYRGRDDRDQGESVSLRLQVSPSDASVYVDGEFRGTGRESSSLRLRPGRHRIEIVRPGFRTLEREVEVRVDGEMEFDLEKM